MLQCACQRAKARSSRPLDSIQQIPVAVDSGENNKGWGGLDVEGLDGVEERSNAAARASSSSPSIVSGNICSISTNADRFPKAMAA